MKLWIKIIAIAIMISAIIIAGCTGKVTANEKDKRLYTITEKNCSGIIGVDVIDVQRDNRAALTAGLQEVEGTHKVIFYSPKQTSINTAQNPTSGYDVFVEVNESCRQ